MKTIPINTERRYFETANGTEDHQLSKWSTSDFSPILTLLDGSSFGTQRFEDIEEAVRLMIPYLESQDTSEDLCAFIPLSELQQQFGATERTIRSQFEKTLGPNAVVKIGQTHGIRRVRLLEFFNRVESGQPLTEEAA